MNVNLSRYSPLLLRLSLALVFLWFGVDKFANPGYWAHQVPETIRVIAGITEDTEYAFVHAMGVFEMLVGSALAIGILTRHVAAIASVFLFSIIVTTGLTPATVRDVGLLGISVYLVSNSAKTMEWNYLRRGKGLLALLVVLATGVATPFALGINGTLSTNLAENGVKTESVLVFLEPSQDEVLQTDTVEVKLGIAVDLRKLGVSHIHFRLDGKVVKVVYDAGSVSEVSIFLKNLSPGEHLLSAYLAYIDHTELREYTTSIKFSVLT